MRHAPVLLVALGLSACIGPWPDPGATPIPVDGDITSDATWERGRIYDVNVPIFVEENVTLTIESGATV